MVVQASIHLEDIDENGHEKDNVPDNVHVNLTNIYFHINDAISNHCY